MLALGIVLSVLLVSTNGQLWKSDSRTDWCKQKYNTSDVIGYEGNCTCSCILIPDQMIFFTHTEQKHNINEKGKCGENDGVCMSGRCANGTDYRECNKHVDSVTRMDNTGCTLTCYSDSGTFTMDTPNTTECLAQQELDKSNSFQSYYKPYKNIFPWNRPTNRFQWFWPLGR